AGYTKDPITAQGITDAFHSAEWCAAVLDEALTGGRPYAEAMAGYQRDRDRHVRALYQYTTRLATLEPPPPEVGRLLAAVAQSQQDMDAFVSVTAGTVSPDGFFDPGNVARIMAATAPA